MKTRLVKAHTVGEFTIRYFERGNIQKVVISPGLLTWQGVRNMSTSELTGDKKSAEWHYKNFVNKARKITDNEKP